MDFSIVKSMESLSRILLVGEREKGRSLAKEVGKALLGDHLGDLLFFAPAENFYSVGELAAFRDEAGRFPCSGSKRLLVLEEAHKMLPIHANSLLKTLEEAPPSTHILLLTSHPHELLPTIRSRLTAFFLSWEEKSPPQKEELLDFMGALLEGNLPKLFSTAQKLEELFKKEGELGDSQVQELTDFLCREGRGKFQEFALFEATANFRSGLAANLRLKTALEVWALTVGSF